jgi:long-chain acyl-CoA synthetase
MAGAQCLRPTDIIDRMTDFLAPEILKALPESVGDVIRPWGSDSPDRLAVVEAAGSWTYGQLDAVVADARTWLRESGVRPGDRVMIVCENWRAVVAIFLALAGIDAWWLFANARLSAREIDAIRDHCGARRVIYTTSVSPHATQHAKRHGATIGIAAGLGTIGLGALNEDHQPEPIEKSRADRVAALIYTWGSTGLRKGVVLAHRNLLFVAAISAKNPLACARRSCVWRGADVSRCRSLRFARGHVPQWGNTLRGSALRSCRRALAPAVRG